ncbi:hypothetical protein DXI23_06400 [Marinobacter flavimaris]|uniref:Uncharacterized protein n=2 Tax=Marinobacter TaxID=2742 RepID=A0A3D8H5C9_9GAMM|nr:hypothetical protein ACP86_16165 [Marinobacter sp. CP1]MBI46339.1 hypothetical protein [Marinobacter sp.]PPI81481.1 hypothetical protein MDHKLMBL_05300 [Marinobacter flavimaris]HAP52540.1 hypothetical protein [Marinobacter adhaerens]RDU41933.1 hypothetical protein DXI23_06400 [Marinobacter flavimaris]
MTASCFCSVVISIEQRTKFHQFWQFKPGNRAEGILQEEKLDKLSRNDILSTPMLRETFRHKKGRHEASQGHTGGQRLPVQSRKTQV